MHGPRRRSIPPPPPTSLSPLQMRFSPADPADKFNLDGEVSSPRVSHVYSFASATHNARARLVYSVAGRFKSFYVNCLRRRGPLRPRLSILQSPPPSLHGRVVGARRWGRCGPVASARAPKHTPSRPPYVQTCNTHTHTHTHTHTQVLEGLPIHIQARAPPLAHVHTHLHSRPRGAAVRTALLDAPRWPPASESVSGSASESVSGSASESVK